MDGGRRSEGVKGVSRSLAAVIDDSYLRAGALTSPKTTTGTEGLSGVFAGRYAIQREIGRGASAIVYVAHDQQTDHLVAVKVLREVLQDSTASTRFLKEIEHHQELSHPRIVKMLDWGSVTGRPYLVLPYMDGGTLRHRLQQERQLSYTNAISIAIALCDALTRQVDRPSGLLEEARGMTSTDSLQRATGQTQARRGLRFCAMRRHGGDPVACDLHSRDQTKLHP